MEKVVVTCALSGSRMRAECPNVPITPEEYAHEAVRARDAGACILHLHARDPQTGAPSHKLSHFRDGVEAIRAAVPEVVLNLSTGAVGLAASARVAPAIALNVDYAAVSMGSFNFGDFSQGRNGYADAIIYENSFADISSMIGALSEASIGVDFECYEIGHMANVEICNAAQPPACGVYSFILGVDGAMPAKVENLTALVDRAASGAHWTAVIVNRAAHWSLIAAALAAGGSVRVGFEDNPYLRGDHVAASNGDLVEKAVHLAREMGRSIASPDDVRNSLKGWI